MLINDFNILDNCAQETNAHHWEAKDLFHFQCQTPASNPGWFQHEYISHIQSLLPEYLRK